MSYFYSGFIIVAVSSLILTLTSFFVTYDPLELLLSFISVVIYGFYIIFDTKQIAGGQRGKYISLKGELSIDDYILGSMMLYTDIIVLFIKILKILDKLNGKDKKE